MYMKFSDHFYSELSNSNIITELKSKVNVSWFQPKTCVWNSYEHFPENEFTCDWGIHGTCSPYGNVIE